VSRPIANRVRIIGGSLRGRVIRIARDAAIRPTPDRVRETLFNWLGQDLSGRRTLEPFAGTGVLSLEALSRGAELAVAVDQSRAVAGALREAAQSLGVSALEVHPGDARAYLEREARSFDVIFLDPPFAEQPWSWLLPMCAARLAPQGFIYAEAAHGIDVPPCLALHRQARAGQVHYHLLRHPEA
jgi:16S rRNA (guanine966-N2)-methyltransferase